MNLPRTQSWVLSLAPAATWIIAAIIGCEAIWIAQTFNSSALLLPLMLLFAIAVALRVRFTSFEASSIKQEKQVALARGKLLGSWLMMLVSATALVGVVSVDRVANNSESSVNYLSLVADIIAHTAWLCTALMLVAWPRTGHPMMLPMGVVVGLVTIAAGGVSQTLNSQTAAAIAFCIFFVAGSQTVGAAHAWLSATANSDTTLGGTSKLGVGESRVLIGMRPRAIPPGDSTLGLKWLMSLVVLSVILTVTSTLATATQEVLPNVQTFLQRGLKDTLESVAVRSPIGSGLYVDGSSFGSVRANLLNDPQGVALRVYADSTPGYLRGSVFDVFTDRRWMTIETLEQYQKTRFTSGVYSRSVKPSEIRVSRTKGPATKKLRHFDVFLKPNDGEASALNAVPQIQTVEVHNDPSRGSLVFTPLSAAWIEASTRTLQISGHSHVIAAGIDLEQPYIAGASQRPEKETISEGMREVLLAVPSNIAVVADAIVEAELGGATNAQQKADRIRDYFQRNFTYSLDRVTRPRLLDPIVHFFQSKHPAHCEYFATATAMLLRRANVPTRYVTGYVADEESDEDDYWIARNSDAHAWVEAYDDISQTWFPVESTPGRSYQTVTFAGQVGESVNGSSGEDVSMSRQGRSLLGHLAAWWAVLRSNDPLITAYRYLQLPLLVVLCTLVWLRRRSIHHTVFDPSDVQSHKLLAKADRRLRKQGLVRAPRETLHQFADRIESSAFEKKEKLTPGAFANWYRSYGNARYQGQLPTPFEFASQR